MYKTTNKGKKQTKTNKNKMALKLYKKTPESVKFMKELGEQNDEWLFNFTGRDERFPKLKINFLRTVEYNMQKINGLEKGLWGVKIIFTREQWETMYKKSGECQLVMEVLNYNKNICQKNDCELFRLPVILKDINLYKIKSKDILNDKICNINIKIIKCPEYVYFCVRFKM
mgnify:CR=1 FL=1